MAFPIKRRRTRPPDIGPLRRLPGQSIREEWERLFDDKVMGYFFAFLITWLFAGWSWLYVWTGQKPSPRLATVFALLVTAYCAYRIWHIWPEFRNLNLGERGERRVSELLRGLRDHDYVTFDDVLLGGMNVDHIVVGPGGVFALETKTYSLFGDRTAGIAENGELHLSGKPVLKDVLRQARSSAALISAEVKRWVGRDVWVTPLVVLPGWRIDPPKSETTVTVLNEKTISEFFKTRRESLSRAQIRELWSHLDRSARS